MDRSDALELSLLIKEMEQDAFNKRAESSRLKIEADAIMGGIELLKSKFSDDLEKLERSKYTYSSTQATNCAQCGKHGHTPLRVDHLGGYLCLTCIDNALHQQDDDE